MTVDKDLLDVKAYARLLGMTRNSVYRAVRQAQESGDTESLYYPSLVVGKNKFFSKSRLLKSVKK